MALSLFIEVDTTRPPDVSARKFSDFSKAGMAAAGELWHREFMPRHFEPNNQARYKIRRRTPEYREKKERLGKIAPHKVKKGGRVPLVWGGDFERLMKTSLGFVRPFPTRVTVTMPAPRYVRMKPRSGRPALGEEAVRTTRKESRALADEWGRVTTELLNTFRARRKEKF